MNERRGGERGTHEAANQRVGRAGRNAEPPREQVPEDATEQRADETCCVTKALSTSPLEMVLATARPKKAPSRFVQAASTMAWRGVSTFVPTTVAMEFAVS